MHYLKYNFNVQNIDILQIQNNHWKKTLGIGNPTRNDIFSNGK